MKEVQLTVQADGYTLENDDGLQVCRGGIETVFILPRSAKVVTFVLTKASHPQAVKVTFECDKEYHDEWKAAGILYDGDFEAVFDGRRVGMYSAADDLLRVLWEEGYNYVRCEYA